MQAILRIVASLYAEVQRVSIGRRLSLWTIEEMLHAVNHEKDDFSDPVCGQPPKPPREIPQVAEVMMSKFVSDCESQRSVPRAILQEATRHIDVPPWGGERGHVAEPNDD